MKRLLEENPDFKNMAEAFARLDPDVIRLVALHKDTKYIVNGFSTNITVTAVEDKLMSAMPLDFVTGAVEESLKQNGATLISNQELASNNVNGVEIGTLEFQQAAPTVTGASVQAHSKILIFQTGGKFILIQLAILKQFAQELLPTLDQIADTVKRIEE